MGRIEVLGLDYLMGPMGRMRHVLYSDTLCCFFVVFLGVFFFFALFCLALRTWFVHFFSGGYPGRLPRAGTMHFT